jgi:transposase
LKADFGQVVGIMEDVAALREQVATLLGRVAELEKQLQERDARIAELEAEAERLRRKGYKPQPNHNSPPKTKRQDRRTKRHRKHPGTFREPPKLEEIPPEQVQHHDVNVEQCPCCGSGRLSATGQFEDHVVVDIPEPKPEYHRYRRHEFECQDCGKKCQGRGGLELPGSHIGPRARLLNMYCRGHLGISLGKSCDLLGQWWGIPLSRAGALGHLAWGGKLFDPIVTRLLELLRKEDLIHADETGWRIDGKNVWAWCFANPRIAIYLIRNSRGSQVLREALGDSLPGVLVCDFYASYNCLDAKKQRCLVHLLRELHSLREKVPAICVTKHIQPLIELFQDAIALAKRREELLPATYDRQCDAIYQRYAERATAPSTNAHVIRIQKRLQKYVEEMFTFLEKPHVPPDNTPAERDIRSVAAARSDGGVNRADWGAKAFANIKSVIRTCQKQSCNFLHYGLEVVRAVSAAQTPPLPLTLDST